jgi:hypothetical protein
MFSLPISNETAAIGSFSQAVRTAKTHILVNQQNASTLTDNERLAELTLLDARYFDDRWNINIRVTNLAGENATFQL